MNMYYLDSRGKLISTIPSATYSQQKTSHSQTTAKGNRHNVNFVRPFPTTGAGEKLMMAGFNNNMQKAGALYEFDPSATMPKSNAEVDIKGLKNLGDIYICDADGDGKSLLFAFRTSFGSRRSGFIFIQGIHFQLSIIFWHAAFYLYRTNYLDKFMLTFHSAGSDRT